VRTEVRAVGAGLLVVCAVLGFAAAFALATAAADTGPAQTTSPPTTTEPPITTEPPPTEPAPPTPPLSPRRPTIPPDVTVGGIPVGGLAPYEASSYVRSRFSEPLALRVGQRRVEVAPGALAARPNIQKAISRARFSRPAARVALDVSVSRARIARYVDRLARGVDRAPVDAGLRLAGATVRAVPGSDGRRLERLSSRRAIRTALKTHVRGPVALSVAPVRPKITESDLGAAIVILRESNRLRYYVNAKLVKTFGVATGQASFPTPLGSYEIVTLQRNPWWYPPPSDWAEGQDPVPPGPGNPLGTRWMGISAPYVGIHGTPDAASIGYSASHGCIRMRISEAEWLFQHVEVGTPVFIVRK
jgi:lipoprotein-anchoring transpeptidase ErfK/SrfK